MKMAHFEQGAGRLLLNAIWVKYVNNVLICSYNHVKFVNNILICSYNFTNYLHERSRAENVLFWNYFENTCHHVCRQLWSLNRQKYNIKLQL